VSAIERAIELVETKFEAGKKSLLAVMVEVQQLLRT